MYMYMYMYQSFCKSDYFYLFVSPPQDDLDLPVTIKSGHLGKLTLKIPWKNLYSAPVEATIEGLYVLVVPNTGMKLRVLLI